MKKSPALAALALAAAGLFAAAAPARAQTDARRALDNFDVEGGVRVPEPAPEPRPAPARKLRMTAMHRAELERSRAGLKPTLYARTTSAVAATGAAARSLDGYTTGDAKVDSFIVEAGTRHGVDPVLLYAIMHQESAFKKRALSHKGARGLMQLMPGTAARFGVRDIFDPAQNINGGARYMRFLLDRFGGDVRLALAGYNAGEGAVDRYSGIPPYRETREYVRRISARYALMRDPESARLAPVVSTAQAAAANAAPADASLIYERNVYPVRLPDGKLMLVMQ
jgi:soluble lytic murein transglycosylase-like protein